MDREAAAQLAMVKEEEEEKKEEVELSVVNEGFVDGGEESGDYETAVGGGREPYRNPSTVSLPLRAPDRRFSAPRTTARSCRRRFGRFVGSASALIGEHRNLSRH